MKHTNAFLHAARGIVHACKTEKNCRIHLLAMALALIMGVLLHINSTEWLFVTGCCMLVLSMELLNTAIEKMCNLISTEYHPLIKIIKDVSAGAVLVCATGSMVIGCVIFIPKLIQFINSFV